MITASARMMIERCDCGAEVPQVCVCTIAPFGEQTVPRVQASAADALDRARVGPRPTEPSAADRAATAYLLTAMQKAWIDPPKSGARLSHMEVAALLFDKTIAEKISLRTLCHKAGIMPAGG